MRAIILWILMFMFLVLAHELGHFTAAKKLWIKVLEFGIGIPPKAFRVGKDKKGTEYTVNWIPLWWFVRVKGENPDDSDTFHAPDSFITAKLWKKLIFLFGGVVVNFFVAWLFFSIAFMQWVTPISIIPENAFVGQSESYLMPSYSFLEQQGLISWSQVASPAIIERVAEDTTASEIGLEQGMEIIRIAGEEVNSYNLTDILWKQFGQTFDVEVKEEGWETKIFSANCGDDECILWVAIAVDGTHMIPATFKGIDAFIAWWHEMRSQTKLTFQMLGNLFSKWRLKQLSWPLCIIKIGWNIATVWSTTWSITSQWLNLFLAFAGMISLALAIFNILPIPALDGGRALGVLIQAIGRMKPEKYFVIENYFNIFFFVVLMWLGIFVMLLDLHRCYSINIPFLG